MPSHDLAVTNCKQYLREECRVFVLFDLVNLSKFSVLSTAADDIAMIVLQC